MKRWMILFLFMMTFSQAGGEYYRVVYVEDNDTLNVRNAPSGSAEKIGVLQPYDTGIIINKCKKNGRTTWCQIDFLNDDHFFFVRDIPHGKGWVNKHYLKKAYNIIYSHAISRGKNSFRVVGIAPNDRLNVREHPRSSAKIVGYLENNDRCIQATNCHKIEGSNWCYLAYDTYMGTGSNGLASIKYPKLGWVNMRFLEPYDEPICRTEKNRFYDMTFSGETY